MAEYRFPGETTDLVVTVPDENKTDDGTVPEWALRILDAWLHGKILNFEGCDVPRGVQYILNRHFYAKHTLGVCSTCIEELMALLEIKRKGGEKNEETDRCDVSCVGTDCLHQRQRRSKLEPEVP